MNAHVRSPGGVSVGQLREQPVFEACIITYLRLWSDGQHGQTRLQDMLAEICGPARGASTLERWAELIGLITQFRRRSLMRHALDCPCLGADEAWFANFMATATTGDREDALMLATLLVRPDIAPMLTDLAQQFGLDLKRAIAQQDAAHATDTSATIH